MSRALIVTLLLSGWVSSASAQKQKIIDEPVDRPTAWTSFWIPSPMFFAARFIADGPEVTLDFKAQIHKTLSPEQGMRQQIDNVSIVKGIVYDQFLATVPADSFLFLTEPAEMFRFHDVPANDRVFLDTFAAAPNSGWDLSQRAFWVDPNVVSFAASAPNDVEAPSNNSGGSLGLGQDTDTAEFASTSITIGGLQAGFEYVLDFWWKAAADDSLAFGSAGIVEDGSLFVQVLGSEAILAAFDVRPGSCNNLLRVRGGGQISAAVLGTSDLDVRDVNLSTLSLLGSVAPLRSSVSDFGRPASGGGACPCPGSRDGTDDLLLRFRAQDVIPLLGPLADGDILTLWLTGNLNNGRPFTASDCVVIEIPGPHLASDTPTSGALEISGGPRGVRRIAYALSEPAPVRLGIYDVAGRLSAQLVDAVQAVGAHETWWDPKTLPNGVYFLRLEASERTEVVKTVVIH